MNMQVNGPVQQEDKGNKEQGRQKRMDRKEEVRVKLLSFRDRW